MSEKLPFDPRANGTATCPRCGSERMGVQQKGAGISLILGFDEDDSAVWEGHTEWWDDAQEDIRDEQGRYILSCAACGYAWPWGWDGAYAGAGVPVGFDEPPEYDPNALPVVAVVTHADYAALATALARLPDGDPVRSAAADALARIGQDWSGA